MAYTLPQVKVFQEFALAQNDATQDLNPLIIGPRYTLVDYYDKATRGNCTNKPYAGSKITLEWSANIATDSVPDQTSYKVTLSDVYVRIGGDAATFSGTALASDVKDGKASKFSFTSLHDDVTPGTYLRLSAGDTYVKVMSRDDNTVELADSVPAAVASGASSATVIFVAARFVASYDVPSASATVSSDEDGVDVVANIKIDGAKVLQSTAYLSHRALRTDNTGVIGTVDSDTAIVQMCGPIVPANPLAYGLYLTLRNCPNATVHYMAIASDDHDGWDAALDMATNTNSVHAICPITECKYDDPTDGYGTNSRQDIIDLVAAHCKAMSEPEQKSWRIAFVSSIPEQETNEDPYTYATRIAEESRRLSSKRIFNVFPGQLTTVDGHSVDGIYAAAAVCGLACSMLPQQPITNVELGGFIDIPATYSVFSRAALNKIAEGGTLIVMQDRPGSVVYIRHQISTAYAKGEGVATAELSMVRNLDSISYYFANRFAPYIGRYNVTPALLAELRGVLSDGLAFLQTSTEGTRLIGPQVLSEGTEIRSIFIKEKDHVVADVALNLPAPFNNFDLHLQVI